MANCPRHALYLFVIANPAFEIRDVPRFNRLRSNETELLGRWIDQAGSIVADDVTNRIEALVSNYLKEVGTSADGWDVLYVDPSDGRYWELTYPDSGAHGGGAPKLSVMTAEQVNTKYGV